MKRKDKCELGRYFGVCVRLTGLRPVRRVRRCVCRRLRHRQYLDSKYQYIRRRQTLHQYVCASV